MSIEDKARQIFGERAAFYTTSAAHTDPTALAGLIAFAAPQPHWSVLDIATGTGHTALALAPLVGQVIGFDLTPEMLSEAERLRQAQAAANVTFRQGDVHHLPFADGSFDLVTCRRAAHHFSDIKRALAEIARVLRPGGRLVMDDRSVPEDDWADHFVNKLDWYHDESHVREYRPSEWLAMLAGSGLMVEAMDTPIRHRPVTAYTEGVGEANVAAIHAMLEGLTDAQRALLNMQQVDGQPFLNHWYVLVAAHKPH
jgi:SAM-dependent methyltransferase